MKVINFIALLLVVIGALNWGMVGFFQIDVVASIFGGVDSVGARVIYALVGLAGLWSLSFFRWFCCHSCKNDVCSSSKCSSCGCGKENCRCGSSCGINGKCGCCGRSKENCCCNSGKDGHCTKDHNSNGDKLVK